MPSRFFSRRGFMATLGVGGLSLLAACMPTQTSPTAAPAATTAPAKPTTAAPAATTAPATTVAGTPAAGATAAATKPAAAGTAPAAGATAPAGGTPATAATKPAAATTPGTGAVGKATGYALKSVGARSVKGTDRTFEFADRQVVVSTAGPADLEFWTINLKGPYGAWIESFIQDYQTVNEGVKIRWVDVPGAEVAQKYLAAVSANQAPDLANTYEMSRFVELGALADISKHLPREDVADYYPGFIQGLTFNGALHGFPWYTSTAGLVYSRKLMQEAGLDPAAPPKTWDEAMTMSRAIKDKSGKYGLLMAVGQGELVRLLQQEGVPIVSEDRKKAALNTPDAVALFKKWQALYRDGYLPPEGTTANPRDSNQWFYASRGAFVPEGPVVVVRRADPAVLTQLDADLSGSLMGKANKAMATLQYLVVGGKSKNVKAAVDFGAYVTGANLQVEFITQVPILPSRQSVSADPTFVKTFLDKKPTGRSQQDLLDRGLQMSLEELKTAVVAYDSVPSVVGWARMYDLFRQETNKLFATGQTAEATLTTIEQGWNTILAEKA